MMTKVQRNQGKASASKQHPALTSTGWQITDQERLWDMTTAFFHIPKVSTTTWFKPIPKSERPATPEPEWTIPPNDFPEPEQTGKCIRHNTNRKNNLGPKLCDKEAKNWPIYIQAQALVTRLWPLKELVPCWGLRVNAEYDISAVYASLTRLNELHKFSDEEETRVHGKCWSQWIKTFICDAYYKGTMETRKWSEDDKGRSKDFITATRTIKTYRSRTDLSKS
ncbi:hypothetical protein Tco_0770046 [Tanacetum coccineum]|uniref:Uncharacterized protein n=1 Tax=Tanacetum coccineum TaxID=301880 RepID=A0ABQ4ZC14_9ASTR